MSMPSSSMPSSSSLKLPTRHSWKKPPPICHDWMELQEMTTAILQQPIGSLYSYDSQQQQQSESTDTNNANNNRLIWAAQERWKSYEVADPTIQQVEYLIRGHASKIPGSLYYSTTTGNTAGTTTADDEQEHKEHHHHHHHLESMQQLLKRMQQEGMMYMQVRKEQQKLQRARNNNSSSSESSSSDSDSDSDSDSSSSDSSSSDSSDDEENDDNNNNNNKTTALEDFAPPGATIAMYDAILDAMAVSLSAPAAAAAADGKNNNITNIDPLEFLHWSLQALTMEEQDAELVLLFSSNATSRRHRLRHASDQYSMATHVTYNAALRGIAQGIIKNSQQQQQQEYCDNALYAAFQLYNHLTHSNHLPRNTASIIYMCQIVHHALLPGTESGSRVKGNISVTFWKQACQLGLASTELANTILQMHTTDGNNNNNSSSSSSCGPEFDVFLKQLKTPLDQLPQRYRRSVKKNQHSKHY